MEIFKDLVKFNRYKSVESFNNASDITSSTISIVKVDENIMDIYLGRTKLTHSDFPEVNIELRNLIEFLNNKLDNLKIEYDSKFSSIDEKYNKLFSEYILDFENGLIELVNYTDNLSEEISNINDSISNQNKFKDEISKKISEINVKQNSHTNSIQKINTDISALKIEDEHLFELITGIKRKLDVVYNDNDNTNKDVDILKIQISSISNKLLEKIEINLSEINKLKAKNIEVINDISDIKRDILALHSEDLHIFEILNELQSINKTLILDNKLFKENINKEILSLKEKIKLITGVDIDGLETLDSIKKEIDKINEILKNGVNTKLQWLYL